jgi:hypothetical protein
MFPYFFLLKTKCFNLNLFHLDDVLQEPGVAAEHSPDGGGGPEEPHPLHAGPQEHLQQDLRRLHHAQGSVGDPDTLDPHDFGPPGSGSFPFLISVLSGLK